MNEQSILFSSLAQLPPIQSEACEQMLHAELKLDRHQIVVLDDDPTGVQTVHGVHVYTDWSQEAIMQGFQEERMFFILTNSRGMPHAKTCKIHQEIAERVSEASARTKKEFLLVSRGDSTLRGHFPAETHTLRETIEKHSTIRYDGEIICPFFCEGGRYTLGNVHYVKENDWLIPAAQTEFAKDSTFGYSHSNLPKWIEEKTGGRTEAKDVICISLERLRALDVDGIVRILEKTTGFAKIVVNAAAYEDVKVFLTACLRAIRLHGKQFIFRTAAAVPKLLGGISDRPLLTGEELRSLGGTAGGLILVGSHVKKTTAQLEALCQAMPLLEKLEFDVQKALVPGGLQQEAASLSTRANELLSEGKSVLVYTTRERMELVQADKETKLKISVEISDAVTSIVSRLTTRPAFIVAKGGITSSDVGVKALRVKRAYVMGQAAAGVPVWRTDESSKFPGMPYVIFPGNVGGVETLREVVETLLEAD